MMEDIGLMPSSTGEEGGKRTGQKMSHYIIPGGKFETITKILVGDNFNLKWCSVVGKGMLDPDKKPKTRKKSKVKYTCPDCHQNAWARPEANLMCGECRVDMEPEDY